MRRRWHVPEHHLRVSRALGSGGPAMPESLAREIQLLDPDALAPPRPRPRLALVGAVAAAAVAVVIALALSLTGGGSTVVDATELSERPAERGAPAAAGPALLTRSFAGVTYPNWKREFRWRAVGQRSDELAGRRTATVFYRHTHHRIGYTVIAGPPFAPPDDAERIVAMGLVLHRFRVGKQDAVTFVRNGRTCVLSGDVHDPDTLVKLAAWNKGGLRSS
jgi:hypothetical protein